MVLDGARIIKNPLLCRRRCLSHVRRGVVTREGAGSRHSEDCEKRKIQCWREGLDWGVSFIKSCIGRDGEKPVAACWRFKKEKVTPNPSMRQEKKLPVEPWLKKERNGRTWGSGKGTARENQKV